MKSELNKMVNRWHSWSEDRYFDAKIRNKIKADLKVMIAREFSPSK